MAHEQNAPNATTQQGPFWEKPASALTANEVRRIIRHGVAEGVLIAGLFLFLLGFIAGLAGLR
jgi:hypothetical protein